MAGTGRYSLTFLLLLLTFNLFASSDFHKEPDDFETDPLVLEKLDEWQDAKFGIMMHWGPYSQWGVVESWSICSEDVPWCQRSMDNYAEYVAEYHKLKNTFNPVNFNPDSWAKMAKNAGMKYVVFTAKHHDGFSMFDTKLTDYNITDPGCPFSSDKKANITKEIFDSFRKLDFKVGAYFSKPDWHNPNYWSPYWATPDRNVNYDIDKHPEMWANFKTFTHGQVEELMRDYGDIDILWLDGGWVRPSVEWDRNRRKMRQNQDIDIPKMAAMARSYQPGLIFVDRWVPGIYENYLTPEQKIPDQPLNAPWESCITMGDSWSFVPNDNYKSTNRLIHMLIEIVSKGGNFLLNVGPDPLGNFPEEAVIRLEEIGRWMDINSEAIYGTRPIEPFKDGKTCLTQSKDGTIYGLYLADEDEISAPEKMILHNIDSEKISSISLLGSKEKLSWEKVGKGTVITLPESLAINPPCEHAWVVKIVK